MTTATTTANRLEVRAGTGAPRFAQHSARRATARGLAVFALCAALAYGFLSQVWTGPAPSTAPRDLRACNPMVQRCA
ncbi:MAG TPA: hypothetical protein VFP65_16815 [Anaeromyxobacteraceae bacterium]|nr:hypothetical protein [Anaeromyxobacteraceae bacterium]